MTGHDGFGNGPKVAVVVLTNGDGADPEPLLRLALAAARTDAGGRADYLQMNVWALARVPDRK